MHAAKTASRPANASPCLKAALHARVLIYFHLRISNDSCDANKVKTIIRNERARRRKNIKYFKMREEEDRLAAERELRKKRLREARVDQREGAERSPKKPREEFS